MMDKPRASTASAAAVVAQLEALRQQGQRPDPDALVQAAAISSPLEVAEVLAADQWQRWHVGERISVEDYFARHPSVADDAAAALLLVYGEFLIREECGQTPSAEDYLARFPQCANGLRLQLDFHVAFEKPLPTLSAREEPLPTNWARVADEPAAHDEPCAFLAPGREPSSLGRLDHFEVLEVIGRGGMGFVFKARDTKLQRIVAIEVLAPQLASNLVGHALLERIGVGGMGEVYRCGDGGLRRDLAIKVLRAELHGDADAEERFLREAYLTGSLQHPGIVPVHQLGRLADGRPCYTMKLVRGRTLADLLREEPNEPERLPRLLAVVEKVCQAMAFAHSKGIIHRDLKPSNVMVGEFGEVQVMDWGLSKQLSRAEPVAPPDEATENVATVAWMEEVAGLSRAGSALGTPSYMPPEQAAGDWDIVDERADVFALGAVQCEALTGRPPYQVANRDEVLRRARRGDLSEALGRLAKCDADAVLVDLCRECLAVERLQRPRHAGVVAERLASYQAEVRERLRKAELQRARAEVQTREQRKRRRLQAALALAALALLTGGAAVWWQAQRRQAETDRNETVRRAEADGAAAQVMAEARLLGEQARAEPLNVAGYDKAVLAAAKVGDVARTGGASQAVQRQADDLLAELTKEAEAAARDRRLLAALLDVRGPREGPKYQSDANGKTMMALAEPTADEQFSAAFRQWGVDVESTSASEAAALLKERPPLVVTEVIAALDEWTSERRRQGKSGDRLADLVALLDADPGSKRRELREILARNQLPVERALGVVSGLLRPVPIPFEAALGRDRVRLRQLADQTDPAAEPILGQLTLVRALGVAGDMARAEQLLRAAIVARPREVVLYHTLGQLLTFGESPRWAEAAESYGAARTLRPDLGVNLATALLKCGRDHEGLAVLARLVSERSTNPYLHFQLAYALYAKGQLDEAMAEDRLAIALDLKYSWAHNNLGVALADKGQLDEAVAEFRQAIALEPGFASAHYNLGNALHEKGQLDEAVAEYRQAIALEPKYASAHYNLGNALREKGQLDEAVAEYRQAIALEPRFAGAHNNLGGVLADKGQLDEAVAEYRQAIALEPRFAGAHNNLGGVLADKGQLDEAMAEHRLAIALDPKNAQAHTNLGNALRAKGRMDEAVAEHRQAIALDSKLAQAHSNLGIALAEKGLLDEAVSEHRQAIALDSKLARPHYNLGVDLAHKGQLDEAVAEYRQAIALEPKYASAHYNLGNALREKGQLDEAVAEYRQAIALEPRFAGAHNNLGGVLADKGQLDEAVAEYRQAIALEPKHPAAHYSLGIALAHKGWLDGALAEYREAIQLRPDYAEAHNNLGLALRAKGQLDEAVAEFRKAIAIKPKLVPAHYNLGLALRAKGWLDEALAEFRQAIRLNPVHAEAHCNLGLVLQQRGRFDEALASLRRGQELGAKQPGWRYPSAQWVRDAERLLVLDKQLSAILSGKETPANPGEAVALASMCQQPYKKRYPASARLYADAFAADPKLAADSSRQHRYNAACSAALAAAGQGEDARLLPDRVAAMFCRWAHAWLRDDLTAYAKLAAQNNPAANKVIQQRLAHWRRDPDLASVRDPQALDRLPDSERAAWQALWHDVDELARRVAKQAKAGENKEKRDDSKSPQKDPHK